MSAKLLLEMIRNNTETITGRNVKKILNDSERANIKIVDKKNIKNIKFCDISKNDEWRIQFINELIDIKQGKLLLEFDNGTNMEDNEIENLLEFVSTS